VLICLGVDEHTDEPKMRDVKTGSGLSAVSLVHQQHGRLHIDGQRDGLSRIQIPAEGPNEVSVGNPSVIRSTLPCEPYGRRAVPLLLRQPHPIRPQAVLPCRTGPEEDGEPQSAQD
jgi:hypothetical protein